MTTIAGREAVTHELKTWPEYFAKILDGSKRFELRNSDRDFRVGDLLRLREWRLTDNEYTGREITVRVTYLTTDTNWMNGYSVAMSIEPVADKPTPSEADTTDIIGGFPITQPSCLGCGKTLLIENAWMTDGCPCNHVLGVNNLNETRWRLLMLLQQRQQQELANVGKSEGRSKAFPPVDSYSFEAWASEVEQRIIALEKRNGC